ncbi:Protein CPR-5 [Linum perenne]
MGTPSSAANDSYPWPHPLENGHPIKTQTKKENNYIKKKKKKKISIDAASSSSSASSSFSSSYQRNSRISGTHLHRKLVIAPLRRRGGDAVVTGDNLDAIALPLGMSFAAVIAQVLEKKDAEGERMSSELLSAICTTAVKESLANVFGHKFELFASNFQRSFRSTLRTLRVINESSFHKGHLDSSHPNPDKFGPDLVSNVPVASSTSCSGARTFNDESELPFSSVHNRLDSPEEKGDESDLPFSSVHNRLDSPEEKGDESDLPFSSVHNRLDSPEEMEVNLSTVSLNRELTVHGQTSQLTCSPSSFGSRMELSTVERSVMEQARFNDLKTLEIGLSMRRLKLKEEQIALGLDSNRLERSKLSMGVAKASFRAEKFKTQLEDTRHGELLQSCMDCLVAGLFIMSFSLSYSAYVYSHRRITEATESCATPFEGSKSWWMPKPVSSLSSGLHTLKCQVQVLSRMVFGLLMILAVATLLLQRSATVQRTMPVTFILLLLGVACGYAGKICVDTLGGDGYLWLMLWEVTCLLHLVTNFFTSTVFHVLCGSLDITQGSSHRKTICPYWVRRSIFYTVTVLVLPLCCGLLPFAGFGEWKDHFYMLAVDVSAAGY